MPNTANSSDSIVAVPTSEKELSVGSKPAIPLLEGRGRGLVVQGHSSIQPSSGTSMVYRKGKKITCIRLAVVVHTFNPSSPEAEASGSL